jgi:hypothetical protein
MAGEMRAPVTENTWKKLIVSSGCFHPTWIRQCSNVSFCLHRGFVVGWGRCQEEACGGHRLWGQTVLVAQRGHTPSHGMKPRTKKGCVLIESKLPKIKETAYQTDFHIC